MRHLLWVILCIVTLASCDDFDSWTTSHDAHLSFSVDTLSFDTVITKQKSVKREFWVHNRNSKGIRISRIALGQGSASPFRINVDGESLTNGMGTDFEVRAKDSIIVRANVILPEVGDETYSKLEDWLDFTLENGDMQRVMLRADGMDVEIHHGLYITTDTLIYNKLPLLIYDSLVVAKDVTLTLAPGTRLMFHDGVSLTVHGTLKALGTQELPIVFRGDRVDRMFSYLPYDNTPNRWGGIHFTSTSHSNELIQCDIHSGDYGVVCDSCDATKELLWLENSIIHNVGGDGLRMTQCVVEGVGTQISNTLGDCMYIKGGAYNFVNCTLAQFYPWSSDRGNALYITNIEGDNYYYLQECHFYNCIITGYAEDVIMGNIAEDEDGPKCDYLFSNSLLRTVVSEDTERFVNVKYDIPDSTEVHGKKNFKLFDTKNYLYDFTPVPESQAINLGRKRVVEQFPIDRNGHNRFADGVPDAGAYEYFE